jgi:hypothetical protein
MYFCLLLEAVRERINKPFYEREDTPEDGVQWKAIVGKQFGRSRLATSASDVHNL